MSDKESKREKQGDFFSSMMFGPRAGSNPDSSSKSNSNSSSNDKKSESKGTDQDASQMEQVIELVQSIGPVIEQLAPVATAAKSYLSKKLKEMSNESSSSSKEKNES